MWYHDCDTWHVLRDVCHECDTWKAILHMAWMRYRNVAFRQGMLWWYAPTWDATSPHRWCRNMWKRYDTRSVVRILDMNVIQDTMSTWCDAMNIVTRSLRWDAEVIFDMTSKMILMSHLWCRWHDQSNLGLLSEELTNKMINKKWWIVDRMQIYVIYRYADLSCTWYAGRDPSI